jgi:hypothetical protein
LYILFIANPNRRATSPTNPIYNFVDDPEKLYRLRRQKAQQTKKLDFVDSKSEDEGSLESSKNPPPQSPQEN